MSYIRKSLSGQYIEVAGFGDAIDPNVTMESDEHGMPLPVPVPIPIVAPSAPADPWASTIATTTPGTLIPKMSLPFIDTIKSLFAGPTPAPGPGGVVVASSPLNTSNLLLLAAAGGALWLLLRNKGG